MYACRMCVCMYVCGMCVYVCRKQNRSSLFARVLKVFDREKDSSREKKESEAMKEETTESSPRGEASGATFKVLRSPLLAEKKWF